MTLNDITRTIIGAAIEVHRELGPGLLESSYEVCLVHELRQRGLGVETQKPVPIIYKGVMLDCAYKLDLLVEGQVIVELKAIGALEPVHEAQLLSHLKLSGCQVGLLINFNVSVLKSGIRRLVLASVAAIRPDELESFEPRGQFLQHQLCADRLSSCLRRSRGAPFFSGLDTLTVYDPCTGACLSARFKTDPLTQPVMNLLPDTLALEGPEVVVDRWPDGKVVRQLSPLAASSDHVIDGIDHFTHIQGSRPAFHSHRDERLYHIPLCIRQISIVRTPGHQASSRKRLIIALSGRSILGPSLS